MKITRTEPLDCPTWTIEVTHKEFVQSLVSSLKYVCIGSKIPRENIGPVIASIITQPDSDEILFQACEQDNPILKAMIEAIWQHRSEWLKEYDKEEKTPTTETT